MKPGDNKIIGTVRKANEIAFLLNKYGYKNFPKTNAPQRNAQRK